MPPRLLVTNSVILNGGDAAIVLSMAASLRREFGPETEIRVLCHAAAAARRLYGGELEIETAMEEAHRLPGRSRLGGKILNETLVPRLRLGLLTREERRVDALFRWADAIVSCGGGFMTDRYSPGKRLAGLRRALASGKPLIFYAQSMGPFEKTASRRAFKNILDRAAAITVRDARSLEELKSLGLDGRAELTADEAFLFDAPAPEGAPDPREGLETGRPLVAVSLRNWHFPGAARQSANERYLAAVAGAVRALVEQDRARILFISTCQGVPEYGHDDSAVALRVLEQLPAPVREEVRVDRDYHHPAELRTMLGRCDAVVATRMHVSILAMLAGTPALAVGYEAKSAELYSRLGLDEWCLDIAGPQVENLPERARALLAGREKLREGLTSGMRELAEAARGNARAVRRVLAERGIVDRE